MLDSVIDHVGFNVSRAPDLLAIWMEAYPVFPTMATVWTLILDSDVLKGFWRSDVFRCAVRTVFFRLDCVETLHFLLN